MSQARIDAPPSRRPAGALLSRRCFLAGGAALTAGLSAQGAAVAAAATEARPLLPREILFGNPDITWARLSPDGVHIAYLAPVDGVRNLWVVPVGDLQAASPITRAT